MQPLSQRISVQSQHFGRAHLIAARGGQGQLEQRSFDLRHDIRQGLRTFTTSYYMAPGRLNIMDLDGFRVLVDYAHNPPAVLALGEFVERLAQPSP